MQMTLGFGRQGASRALQNRVRGMGMLQCHVRVLGVECRFPRSGLILLLPLGPQTGRPVFASCSGLWAAVNGGQIYPIGLGGGGKEADKLQLVVQVEKAGLGMIVESIS